MDPRLQSCGFQRVGVTVNQEGWQQYMRQRIVERGPEEEIRQLKQQLCESETYASSLLSDIDRLTLALEAAYHEIDQLQKTRNTSAAQVDSDSSAPAPTSRVVAPPPSTQVQQATSSRAAGAFSSSSRTNNPGVTFKKIL